MGDEVGREEGVPANRPRGVLQIIIEAGVGVTTIIGGTEPSAQPVSNSCCKSNRESRVPPAPRRRIQRGKGSSRSGLRTA